MNTLLALAITLAAPRGGDMIDRRGIDALNDARLRAEIVTAATVAPGEAPLAANERRMILHPFPVWYVAGDGSLAPISTGIEAAREANAAVWRADANTVQFRVRENGAAVYRAGGHQLVVTPAKRAAKLPGEVEIASSPANTPTETTPSERGTVQRGIWLNTRVQHEVLPGAIKETIWLDAQPSGLLGAKWLSVVFSAQSSTLSPVLVDGDLHWQADGVTVLRWPAPIVYDANGAGIAAEYSLRQGGRVALLVSAPALLTAAYPVAIDPTTTTGSGDGVANICIYRTTTSLYKKVFYKISLPSMSGNTVTDATLDIYADSNLGPMNNINLYAGSLSWTTGDSAATLDAKALGTAVSTGNTLSSGTGYKTLNIFGGASSGVSKFYTDSPTGGDLTTTLVWSAFSGSAPNATDTTTLILGDDDSGTPSAYFSPYTHGTQYAYVTITYTAGGGGGGSGSSGTRFFMFF